MRKGGRTDGEMNKNKRTAGREKSRDFNLQFIRGRWKSESFQRRAYLRLVKLVDDAQTLALGRSKLLIGLLKVTGSEVHQVRPTQDRLFLGGSAGDLTVVCRLVAVAVVEGALP